MGKIRRRGGPSAFHDARAIKGDAAETGQRLTLNAEQLKVRRAIGAGGGEIVECAIGHLDDVIGDELGALARRDFGMLQAVFPFVDRPSGEVVASELGKDRLEIDLAVAERPVAPGALEPTLVAAINALL